METGVKYEPKFGRVLIKRELKKKTEGGIILPDSVVKRHAELEGVIVALGETAGWTETYLPAIDIDTNEITHKLGPVQTMHVGDRVLFGRHAGAWIDGKKDPKTGEDTDEGTLFICQDQDILAVIKE